MQLRNKILLYFISLIIVTLLTFGLSAYQLSYESAIESDKNDLELLLKKKLHTIFIDYEKYNSINHAIVHILDAPDEKLTWLLFDASGKLIFPQNINQIFSHELKDMPLDTIVSGSVASDIFEISPEKYLWISDLLKVSGYRLAVIQKINEESFSQSFAKLSSRLIIVGVLITWVAVWFSLIFATKVTNQITYHKNAEEELNVANQLLTEARDIAEKASQTKSEFLSNISHEIRTPLTAIIGFAETCLESGQKEPDRVNAIKKIIRSGSHLMHIINEILDFSKVESGKLNVEMIPVSLNEILDDVEPLITVLAESKNIAFKINYTYPLPDKFISDPVRIKQILLNLCSNAIKFTNQGSVNLNVSFHQNSSTIVFEIIDTGIGMSAEQQQRIFNPFEQADSSITRNYGGTGLGLSLSKKLTELLNGDITVKSTLNEGSHFTITIKVEKDKDSSLIYENNHAKIKNAFDNCDAIPYLDGKILIAEDSPDIQELLRLLLRKIGLEMEVVNNGKEAIQAVQEAEYDLLMMDIQMPVMDGLTAMQQLKQLNYTKPVIAITANAMQEDRKLCKQAGFSDFISKPINRNNLYSTLAKYLKVKKETTTMEPIVTSELLKDDPDLIDLIDKFISRLPQMRDEILQLYAENNQEEFLRKIHQLKGVGGNYGYPMLSELCAGIEETCREDFSQAKAMLDEFKVLSEKILAGSDENHNIATANN